MLGGPVPLLSVGVKALSVASEPVEVAEPGVEPLSNMVDGFSPRMATESSSSWERVFWPQRHGSPPIVLP